jgi:hypothetical protein
MVSDRYEHTFVGKKRADPRTKSPTATRDKRHGPRDIHFSLDGWFIVERYKPQLAMSMFVHFGRETDTRFIRYDLIPPLDFVR